MPRKRVWLFVVEGETDKTAIGLPMEELVESETIEFDVFRSDIFGMTQYWASADPIMRVKDICERVRKEIINHLKRADYSWEDLDKIVLLLDKANPAVFAPRHVDGTRNTLRCRYSVKCSGQLA